MAVRPLTEQDLRWLVCPVCHQALHLDPALPTIRCLGCSRLYPVLDGLPALLDGRKLP